MSRPPSSAEGCACGGTVGSTRALRAAVVDIDGTLVLGGAVGHAYSLLPGGLALIDALRERDMRIVALTNGTLHTPAQYVDMLADAGIRLTEEEVLTPASVAADWYRRRGVRRVLVLGVRGVWAPLADAGIEVVLPGQFDASATVDAVLVGWHPDFVIADLEAACKAVWAGAELGATSKAPIFAGRNGPMIGISGVIVAGITKVTGKRARNFGKPASVALRMALARMRTPAAHTVLIGDDPTLEIAMGAAAGCYTLGVLSGIGDAAAFAAAAPGRRAYRVVPDAAAAAGVIRELVPAIA